MEIGKEQASKKEQELGDQQEMGDSDNCARYQEDGTHQLNAIILQQCHVTAVSMQGATEDCKHLTLEEDTYMLRYSKY